MTTLFVRLAEGAYVSWSSTVDAPTSPVMTRRTLEAHLQTDEGLSPEQASALVLATDASGTSDAAVRLEELIGTNRAGPGERRLSLEELLEEYG